MENASEKEGKLYNIICCVLRIAFDDVKFKGSVIESVPATAPPATTIKITKKKSLKLFFIFYWNTEI